KERANPALGVSSLRWTNSNSVASGLRRLVPEGASRAARMCRGSRRCRHLFRRRLPKKWRKRKSRSGQNRVPHEKRLRSWDRFAMARAGTLLSALRRRWPWLPVVARSAIRQASHPLRAHLAHAGLPPHPYAGLDTTTEHHSVPGWRTRYATADGNLGPNPNRLPLASVNSPF